MLLASFLAFLTSFRMPSFVLGRHPLSLSHYAFSPFLADTMKHIKSEVVTINVGLAASMASFLLGGGEKGKRLALPHSRVMIHQPMGGAQGQASDIKVEAQQILRIRENLTHEYARMTGQKFEGLIDDMDRDNFMSAAEALEYGLIDRVIEGQSQAV